MKISPIMCISKILIDSYAIKQMIKTKSIFENVVYSILVMKTFCKNTEKIA